LANASELLSNFDFSSLLDTTVSGFSSSTFSFSILGFVVSTMEYPLFLK